jgi:LmbE family N-acetylglucosaminyl deacetylase
VPKLLAIIPHPDDESYSFGGTIALAARAGWDCLAVSCSSGEQGEFDRKPTTAASLGPIRETELARSCRVLGAREPEFWHWPDGALASLDGTEDVHRLFVRLRPDLVLTLGADGVYGHPDHVAVYRWVAAAWAASEEPRPALLFAAFPRGLFLPQYKKCLDLLGDPPMPPTSAIGGSPVHYEVPVARVAATKLAAISAHATQLPGGQPEALFPPGIVTSLLEFERFTDARGVAHVETAALLGSLTGITAG